MWEEWVMLEKGIELRFVGGEMIDGFGVKDNVWLCGLGKRGEKW